MVEWVEREKQVWSRGRDIPVTSHKHQVGETQKKSSEEGSLAEAHETL